MIAITACLVIIIILISTLSSLAVIAAIIANIHTCPYSFAEDQEENSPDKVPVPKRNYSIYTDFVKHYSNTSPFQSEPYLIDNNDVYNVYKMSLAPLTIFSSYTYKISGEMRVEYRVTSCAFKLSSPKKTSYLQLSFASSSNQTCQYWSDSNLLVIFDTNIHPNASLFDKTSNLITVQTPTSSIRECTEQLRTNSNSLTVFIFGDGGNKSVDSRLNLRFTVAIDDDSYNISSLGYVSIPFGVLKACFSCVGIYSFIKNRYSKTTSIHTVSPLPAPSQTPDLPIEVIHLPKDYGQLSLPPPSYDSVMAQIKSMLIVKNNNSSALPSITTRVPPLENEITDVEEIL